MNKMVEWMVNNEYVADENMVLRYFITTYNISNSPPSIYYKQNFVVFSKPKKNKKGQVLFINTNNYYLSGLYHSG
jgi:hypothetical protein